MNSVKLILGASFLWLTTCIIAAVLLLSFPLKGIPRPHQQSSYTGKHAALLPVHYDKNPTARTSVKINGTDALVVTTVRIVR